MKTIKWTLVAAALCLAGNAMADGGRRGHHHHNRHGGVQFGIVIGPSAYWGPWNYPPYYRYPRPYYPPTVVIERTAPPVYIQQEPAAAPATEYWYYCADAKGYYPYVRECPAGWLKVAPRP